MSHQSNQSEPPKTTEQLLGDFELQIAETTTGSIVRRAIEACLGTASKAEINLESEVNNDAFAADEDRLIRVIINLVGNAVKFSPKGTTVTVNAGLDGTRIIFSVSDQGPGIPQELQATIFERYRQLDQAMSTKRHGLGLGLYICKTLVEKHDGNIWVESKVGEGSKFYFAIPVQ